MDGDIEEEGTNLLSALDLGSRQFGVGLVRTTCGRHHDIDGVYFLLPAQTKMGIDGVVIAM